MRGIAVNFLVHVSDVFFFFITRNILFLFKGKSFQFQEETVVLLILPVQKWANSLKCLEEEGN